MIMIYADFHVLVLGYVFIPVIINQVVKRGLIDGFVVFLLVNAFIDSNSTIAMGIGIYHIVVAAEYFLNGSINFVFLYACGANTANQNR